ncbi:ATP12 family protein [Gymnodinialimonas sp. 2305UL16-5]|uniref:ATP12 family chaperone protein n=1 Tax=Gymnodinialimonas mytili TaxID=3126503 RepID=UPI00309AFD8E
MTEWKAKRFWDAAHVVATDNGFSVHLDARPLNTPGKLPLVMPSRAMAEAVATEWNAQEGAIQPLTMPVTRSANSAVERVTPQRADVAAMLASYGETDLLCYRAEDPAELTQRQAAGWDPLLGWAEQRYGARLILGAGVVPVTQPPASIAALAETVAAVEPFPMTALHDLVTLTGSLILGLAVSEGEISVSRAWDLSRIDETWQIEQWGADEEASAAAAAKESQLHHAARFWELSFSE